VQITRDEIAAHHPDVLLPPDEEFAEDYAAMVAEGRRIAATKTVALVAICRNAGPWLSRTLALVEQTAAMFADWSAYIHENDSMDETQGVLAEWHDGERRHVSININGRPHLNHTTSQERTHALAEYRAACQTFVRNGEHPTYTIVFDTDAWGGWSIDGIANSIAWLERDPSLYGMASLSWSEWGPPLTPKPMPLQYDAFAARWNGWRQRDQQWFHHWLPPVGAPPVEFRSAFGQLAIYRTADYLAGTYDGFDCEHVRLHRSIHEATGKRLALNPSMRCVSFWVPDEVKHAR
jgi:hypothetical protein